jgi:hypothetical protein
MALRRKLLVASLVVLVLAAAALTVVTTPSFAARKFPVTFSFSPQGAPDGDLAGSFNNWSRDAQPMTSTHNGRLDGDDRAHGGEYQYKFVVDGSKWFQDPARSLKAPDGFGGYNPC